MANQKKVIQELANRWNFTYNKKNGVTLGGYRGFTIAVYPSLLQSKGTVELKFYAGDVSGLSTGTGDYGLDDGCRMVTAQDFSSLNLPSEIYFRVDQGEIVVARVCKGKVNDMVVSLADAVDKIITVLENNHYVNVDCMGQQGVGHLMIVQGEKKIVTAASAAALSKSLKQGEQEALAQPENVLLGSLGAIVGSLAGIVLAVIFSLMNRISYFSGALGGFCSVWLYKKLGGRTSLTGCIVGCIANAVASYCSAVLCCGLDLWRIYKSSGYNVDFSYVLFHAKEIYELYGELDAYYHNFYMTLGFGVISSLIIVISAYASEKSKYSLKKLDD